MYVCLCNGHREQDIRRIARSGVRSVYAVYEQLGGPPQCGRCLEVAEGLIGEILNSAAADGHGRGPTSSA